MFPGIGFTPETLMGDLFRLTRKLAPALWSLARCQIVRLRQELALIERLVDREVDHAARMRAQFAATRAIARFSPGRVLEFPRFGEVESPRVA